MEDVIQQCLQSLNCVEIARVKRERIIIELKLKREDMHVVYEEMIDEWW